MDGAAKGILRPEEFNNFLTWCKTGREKGKLSSTVDHADAIPQPVADLAIMLAHNNMISSFDLSPAHQDIQHHSQAFLHMTIKHDSFSRCCFVGP